MCVYCLCLKIVNRQQTTDTEDGLPTDNRQQTTDNRQQTEDGLLDNRQQTTDNRPKTGYPDNQQQQTSQST